MRKGCPVDRNSNLFVDNSSRLKIIEDIVVNESLNYKLLVFINEVVEAVLTNKVCSLDRSILEMSVTALVQFLTKCGVKALFYNNKWKTAEKKAVITAFQGGKNQELEATKQSEKTFEKILHEFSDTWAKSCKQVHSSISRHTRGVHLPASGQTTSQHCQPCRRLQSHRRHRWR